VQLDHAGTAGRAVQAVDVLRDQPKIDAALDRSERAMTRVRSGLADQFAPPRVPVPDEFRIARERRRRRELLRIVFRPEPGLRIAKRRHAGFGGNARAGQRGDHARTAQARDELVRNRSGSDVVHRAFHEAK
jgi:hypothetical protein